MKNPLIWILVIIVLVLGGWLLLRDKATTTPTTSTTPPTALEETAAMIPAIGTPATANDIVIDAPKKADIVASPLKVSGRARGNWFFEASAPVVVIDLKGNLLGQGHINATGEWMTTDFVPFTGTIDFTLASNTPSEGAIVFTNDNPSGQASTSRYMAVPVFFKQ